MTRFSAIQKYLTYQGEKYIRPEKAGVLQGDMLQFKRVGQEARLAFSDLAQDFQRRHPFFELERVSNWVNQAQVARPHFWVYLRENQGLSEPMYAFRLYGTAETFGISVEVSIIERKRDAESLQKQARVLACPPVEGTYYYYQDKNEVFRLPATEEARLNLRDDLTSGRIRKILVKTDIPWNEEKRAEDLLAALEAGIQRLAPYYEACKEFSSKSLDKRPDIG